MDKLLELLDRNARLTDEQLAIMLGRSEQEVSERIAGWERDGIIRGYKAVIDWERTDRAYVTALIELRVTPKRNLGFDAIAETIMRFDEVESVYLMSGGYDLAVIVSGRTFKDIAMFVAKRLSTLDSVISTSTHFVLQRYKDSGIILRDEEKDERGVL
ncbi:MAG TPA: Lrp/AsnC family transcriptional regulator [Candidatus Avimonas sp.]|jgi:DNA-binding Lrp family transcriptional regulator|nr:Lrp/AsnC family transcriptional regulator [Candidatus Avimonas sp.]HQA16292.1 Lrp/AsnC family transcriptional regulator [Candidatus Avimonas sp.]HQD38370.1 Lrp/AsnC family transcriptional regulator [Candidatus Avimonas sp.]